jgi:hypothetical protein
MGIQCDFVGLYVSALLGKHLAQIPAHKITGRLVLQAGACYLYVKWPRSVRDKVVQCYMSLLATFDSIMHLAILYILMYLKYVHINMVHMQ